MQGVLASVNFPLDLLPMLEVVQTITDPLLTKLRFHFASGRPTDRIDQPDWLFETATQATEEHLESFKALQPAVQSHGLEKVFYLPFEYARAMHSAVQSILREHVLPRLTQQVRWRLAKGLVCVNHKCMRACCVRNKCVLLVTSAWLCVNNLWSWHLI